MTSDSAPGILGGTRGRRTALNCLGAALLGWLLTAPTGPSAVAGDASQQTSVDAAARLDESAQLLRRGDLEGGLERLEEALAAGYPTPFDIMARTDFRPLRHDPAARRELSETLGRHARESRVTIVTPEQVGERMTISGRLIDTETEAPVTDALVYVFHTTAEGLYAPESPQGGRLANNPYLFAYVRPDADGRFEIRTVRPASYAGFARPNLRHVHYEVEAPGFGSVSSQLYLDRDPEPTPDRRRDAAERGFPILTAEPQEDGTYLLVLTVELRRSG